MFIIIFLIGESTLQSYILSKKMYSFCSTFCINLGADFFISFSVLRITKYGFLTQILQHNSCYLPNDNGLKKDSCVFTHLRLFEWKTSSRCGILHIKLKWDNQLICNIWLSTSSNLLIVWMVFEIFVVYQYNFFNSLIYFSII
jgi:hypothetical protein